MRILLVAHGYPPDEAAGTELHARAVTQALTGTGHDVRVFAANPTARARTHRLDNVDGIRVERLWTGHSAERDGTVSLRDPEAERLFTRAMSEFRPDVVHVVSLIFLSDRLIEIAQRADVPVVLAPTDFWFLCPSVHLPVGRRHVLGGRFWGLNCFLHTEGASLRWAAALARRGRLQHRIARHLRRANTLRTVLQRADLVVTPCAFVRERFIEFGADPARVEALTLGLEAESPPRPPRGSVPLVGFLGAFTREKGPDLLVDAFTHVASEARLVLRGRPVDPPYAAALRTAAATDPRVTVGDALEPGQALPYLATLDLLVIPTRVHESFCRVAREAFVAQVPVLAAAAGALPEIVEPGCSGELFRAGDAGDLTKKLRHLLDNRGFARLDRFRHVKTMDEHALELVERYRRVRA